MHCDRPPSNHPLLVCRGTTSFAGEEGPKQNRVDISLETATCPLSPLDAHLAARRKRYSRSMRLILTSPKLRRWSMPKSRLGQGGCRFPNLSRGCRFPKIKIRVCVGLGTKTYFGCFSRVLWGGLSGSSDEGARQESFGVAVAAAAVDRSGLCAIAGLPEGCQGHVSPPQHGRLDCRRCVISEGSDLSSSPHHMRPEASESMAPLVSSCGSEECR
jgi:hypothetical protein